MTATLPALPETVTVTATSLTLAESTTFNDWRAIGEQLDRGLDVHRWHVADWASHGYDHYRRDYGPALEAIFARGTLHNLASVARRVAPSRRRESLSFTHHAEVASLPDDEQDIWLDDAERHGWSTRELRAEIRNARGIPASTTSSPSTIPVLLPPALDLASHPGQWSDPVRIRLVPRDKGSGYVLEAQAA